MNGKDLISELEEIVGDFEEGGDYKLLMKVKAEQ